MLNPAQAINAAYLNYANFKGRAPRSAFWWFHIYSFLLSNLAAVLVAYTVLDEQSQVAVLMLFTLFAIAVPGLSVAVRRLHDTGRSGWWLLLAFIPVLGALVLLVFWLGKSQPNTNLYGAYPFLTKEIHDL